MTGPRKKICALVLTATAAAAIAGCSRPDANPAVRITGDKSLAIPSTTATTTSTTTEPPSTTLFYTPDGPGASIASQTTTSTTSTTTTTVAK